MQIADMERFVLVKLVEPSGELTEEIPVGHVAKQIVGIFVNHQAEEVLQRVDFTFAEIGVDADTDLAELEIGTERLEFKNRTHGETLFTDEPSRAFVEDLENQSIIVPRLDELGKAIFVEDKALGGEKLLARNIANIVDVSHKERFDFVLVHSIEQLAALATLIHLINVLPVLGLQGATPVT